MMMCALGQQGLEGVEELFLGAVLAGEELHVVDQQQVQVVVLGLQFVEGLALVVLDDVADELLGVQVQHARVGLSFSSALPTACTRWVLPRPTPP
jgi:hypothetical protein